LALAALCAVLVLRRRLRRPLVRENRTMRRFRVKSTIDLYWAEEGETRQVRGTTRDINEHGAAVVIPSKIPVGEKVFFVSRDHSSSVTARVRHVTSQGLQYVVGLEFQGQPMAARMRRNCNVKAVKTEDGESVFVVDVL